METHHQEQQHPDNNLAVMSPIDERDVIRARQAQRQLEQQQQQQQQM